MSSAASFSRRWAYDNLTREPSANELTVLDLFPATCDGDEAEAAKRARRYYKARGPGGLSELWHKRHPDDEDILSSCQDALLACSTIHPPPPMTAVTTPRLLKTMGCYIVPLKARSVAGRRMTIVRLPAPMALDRPLSARALLARWLMILDIRLREDPTPGEEVVFIDVSDLQPSHLKNHFRGTYWKDFVWCMRNAYPLRFSEVHIINTQRLKTMSLLLLHIGLYPWRRKVVQLHANAEHINHAMGLDHFPVEGLPYEYGGKAGAMRDLNDEWTKKLLLNSKWLQLEEKKYYDSELKPEVRARTRHRSAMRNLRGTSGSYDMITRTHSCRSLHRHDDTEEGAYGAYRTLKVADRTFYS